MDSIMVQLTPEDAELFVLFRKYQAAFAFMLKNGVFDVHTGHAVLHFLDQVPMEVEITTVKYRKKVDN